MASLQPSSLKGERTRLSTIIGDEIIYIFTERAGEPMTSRKTGGARAPSNRRRDIHTMLTLGQALNISRRQNLAPAVRC